MRVVHLASLDVTGGAARAAYRLHQGLIRLGIKSRMYTRSKESSDPFVVPFQPSLADRLRRRLLVWGLERRFASYLPTQSPNCEYFSLTRPVLGRTVARSLPHTDVIQIHWTAGLLDYRRFFKRIPKELPVVMTLHDMNHFTGGCHYDLGCGRFTDRCGACPLLGSQYENDPSRVVWRDKNESYGYRSALNFRIVADSHWMAGEARRSALLGRFRVETIHYGLDETVFRPIDRQAARKVLNLPDHSRVILFVADSIANPRKGFDHLLRTLDRFPADRDILLLSVGNSDAASLPKHLRAVHLGHLNDDLLIAAAYSAANVFVIPSMQEAFGQTALEAVACGTPVAGFQAGGIPDIVRDGVNGRLVPVGDHEALYTVIAEILGDADLAARMSAAGRKLVTTQFTLDCQARNYIRLYEEMLADLKAPEAPVLK